MTGSANLGLAAFEGRQHEAYVAFDGEPAWQLFEGYYQRDWKDSIPVETDALIAILPRENLPRATHRSGSMKCRLYVF